MGPEGTDGSPRGDDRIDGLRHKRASLRFNVPGSSNVVRLNGRAQLSAAPKLVERFADRGRRPRRVTVLGVGEVYA